MMLNLDLIFSGKIIAIKKPQTLIKKYFLLWWEITKLIVQIYWMESKCVKYPDLKKYRGQPEIKVIVKQWRLELNELKTELKQLI